jgi:hypothetical protein
MQTEPGVPLFDKACPITYIKYIAT